MAKNLPSLQFYPGDWMKDGSLRFCSPAARGIWIDLICLSFEMPNRGIFRTKFGQKTIVISSKNLSEMVSGCKPKMIKELIEKGVLKRGDRTGTFYVKRVLEDELKRRRKARNGRKGGQQTGQQTGSKNVKQTPPSSSSSSSSPSGIKKNNPPSPPKGGNGVGRQRSRKKNSMSAMDAWGLLMRTAKIRPGQYAEDDQRESWRKALEDLPADVALAGETLGWQDLSDGNKDVLRGQFLKMWKG